ncbi:D-rhamnosyltransferase WbpZ [Hydrogenophilus islandicus]
MLRILHLFKTSRHHTLGGIEIFIDTLARAQHQLGVPVRHTLFALAPHESCHIEPHLTTYCHRKTAELRSTPIALTALAALEPLVRQSDLIHLHYPYPFADALLFLLATRYRTPLPPLLITYHSDIVKQTLLDKLYAPLRHWLMSRAARIIATSGRLAATSPILTRYPTRTHITPLPPPVPLTYTAAPPRPTYFLFLGAPRYYKGLATLIEAAALVQLPVHVAGDGPERPRWQQLAQRLAAPITWHGAVSEATKQELLAGATALILPSNHRSEAFGLVLLEAAAFARPAITTELGTGTSEIVEHGTTGYVIPPNNPPRLAQAMTTLWALPYPQRAAMGKAAYHRVATHYAPETIATAYYDHYRAALTPRYKADH